MNKTDFDALFERVTLDTLRPLGFGFVGKTLAVRDATTTISLIRLGGRMALPGTIAHILCFRHSFLRDLTERVPAKVSLEPFDYPFKLLPSALEDSPESSWQYRPINLNYRHDRFAYSELKPLRVHAWLDKLVHLIGHRFVPWAQSMTPDLVATQIKERGEAAWCESMWLKDYAKRRRSARSA